MLRLSAPVLLLTVMLAGCSDSSNDGDDIPPPPRTLSVDASLDAAEVVGDGAAVGSGTAELVLNLDDGSLSGSVDLTGLDADSVTFNHGYAGQNGPIVVTLEAATGGQWRVPADTVLSAADQDGFQEGATYLLATSAADGALRGQLLPAGVEVLFTLLSGRQEVPPLASPASAHAALTLDRDSSAIIVHLTTAGLDDAVESHVHEATAGVNGPILIGLAQDPEDAAHWSIEETLDADGMAALDAGRLYVNVHTPANPAGEVRGQLEPDGVDVFFTELSGAEVVPPADGDGSGVAAATLVGTDGLTLHVNLVDLDDAETVAVHQAPLMQTGPVLLSLEQDPAALGHWLVENVALSASQRQALSNRGLYVDATTADFPGGAVRGQLIPDDSSAGSGEAFEVTATDPDDGATLAALPAEVVVTFNRDVLAASADTARVDIAASGGDGSFGDGNELAIDVLNVTVTGADLRAELDAASAGDDVYELRLDGSSTTPLTDAGGVALDGDGDGNPGGDFVATFAVESAVTAPTLSQLQADVFTPSCAKSGCHSGPTPPQGLNLSAGQSFVNLVGVASNEVPSLSRVEPGNPDDSYLVRKIEGSASAGSRMPLDGPPFLSNAEIQAIRAWISAGAEDN